jgi:exosortase A-associated hydrolase 2
MNQAAPGPAVARSASFVPAARGQRLRLVIEPASGPACGTVVLAHAFAEEMNKSRRMCARLAEGLAADGWRVVLRDLAGCGDSSGEFRDATWQEWIDDLDAELALADASRPMWLWCVRAGALLAPTLLAKYSRLNLLLWQPATTGSQHLQQFLRLHAGARIVGSAKSAGELSPAQQLRAGQMVEVGGYELAPPLASGLEQATFDLPAGHSGQVIWLDVTSDTPPQPSPASQRVAERLRERGVALQLEAVQGLPFWQTQEIEESETLLDRSRVLLRAANGHSGAAPLPNTAEALCHG